MISNRGMIYLFLQTSDQYLSIYLWKNESLMLTQNIPAEKQDYNKKLDSSLQILENGFPNQLLSISISF